MRTREDLKSFAREELERIKDGSDDALRDFDALKTLCEWCLDDGKTAPCKECGQIIEQHYRFTDWHNERNDEYGSLEDCKKLFDKAIKEDPELRCSIYDITSCPHCQAVTDEGIIFNKNAKEYKD